MVEQALGLALLAAISPPAMLIAALYLATERPAKITALFLLGGLVVVAIVGVGALLAIRAGRLSDLGQHQTRYGLRLGLGIAAIVAAIVIARREPKEKKSDPAKPKKRGFVERMTAKPRPLTAFIVGIFMFGPSVSYLAAVQAVATDKVDAAVTIGVMAAIVVLTVSFAWIPLVAYLIAPEATIRRLRAAEQGLRRHRKVIMVSAIGLIGVLLTIQGVAGLT